MRFIFFFFISFLFLAGVFAEESYLPESANPKTYTILSSCYSQDDITFFKNGAPLGDVQDFKNIDTTPEGCFDKMGDFGFVYYDEKGNNPTTVFPNKKTFHTMSFGDAGTIGVDDRYLYIFNNAYFIPKGMNTSGIKFIFGNYFTDGVALYSFYGASDGHLSKAEDMDIPSLKIWKSSTGTFFFYDKNGFYIEEYTQDIKQNSDGTHITKILKKYPDFDLKTMTASGVFVFDSKNVYSPNMTVPVDMKTFQLFPDGQFARDKNHIFTPTGKVISGIDMSNYIYLGKGIIRSRGKLFMGCKPEIDCDGYELTGFDVASFQVISMGFMDKNGYYDLYHNPIKKPQSGIISYTGSTDYYHDSENVFTYIWGDEYSILTGADIGTFMTFSGTSYAKDVDSCWFEGSSFPCRAKNFGALEAWRALDGKNVYYQDKKILGADPKSFTGISTGGFNWIEIYHYMRDKNRIYYDNRAIINSDPKTFVLMKDLHSKDKNSIYYAGWKIEGADYKTYTPLRYSFARDRNHYYFAGNQLQKIKNPQAVKIISRDSLEYDGKIRNSWCFVSEESSISPSCNE